MSKLDPERLERLAEACAITFYVLLALAFLCTVLDSPGSGFLLLILGSCAHVGRVGLEGARRPKQPARRSSEAAGLRSARPGL